jgi:hypothetical protein
MKQHIEQALHNSSLSLACIYHELRNSNDDHQESMDHIMLAYISTRRAMEKNHDGKRFGSAEAYRAMTLGEQPNAAPPSAPAQTAVAAAWERHWADRDDTGWQD